MSNGDPGSFEEGPEIIPTSEEVLEIFKQLVGSLEYVEERKLSDESGLYLWDIVVPGEDGGTVQYSYSREGIFPEGSPTSTTVYCSFFDADGSVFWGTSVAKVINGEWKLTP